MRSRTSRTSRHTLNVRITSNKKSRRIVITYSSFIGISLICARIIYRLSLNIKVVFILFILCLFNISPLTMFSFLLMLCLASHYGCNSQMISLRQDSEKYAHVEKVDISTGDVVAQSSLSFAFSMPYVQMSTDNIHNQTYLAAFPDGNTTPNLYLFNDIELAFTWDNNSFTFWDMQVSPHQNSMYGILVTEDFNGGMFGRTLSKYDLSQENDVIIPTELFTLPYMWYVNASTFDYDTNKYYALLNNFPGHENSTDEQKILICDMTNIDAETASKHTVILDILPPKGIMLQFITWSSDLNELLYSAPYRSKDSISKVYFGGIHISDGSEGMQAILNFETSIDGINAGPILADEMSRTRYGYVQVKGNSWQFWSIPYDYQNQTELVRTYTGSEYKAFGAASFFDLGAA